MGSGEDDGRGQRVDGYMYSEARSPPWGVEGTASRTPEGSDERVRGSRRGVRPAGGCGTASAGSDTFSGVVELGRCCGGGRRSDEASSRRK